jgi:hypothetical protein
MELAEEPILLPILFIGLVAQFLQKLQDQVVKIFGHSHRMTAAQRMLVHWQ